jgi:hypothetical protein
MGDEANAESGMEFSIYCSLSSAEKYSNVNPTALAWRERVRATNDQRRRDSSDYLPALASAFSREFPPTVDGLAHQQELVR